MTNRRVIAFLENLVLFKIEEERRRGGWRAQRAPGPAGPHRTQQRVKIAPKGFKIRLD